jgi:nucleoside-diphosphate-sugar epimerase
VYAATKREAHVVAKDMGARIVLPGTIYGPDDPSPVGRMHALAARGLLPIGFRKHVKMSLVFVDDCADAVVRALECGRDADAWIAASDVVSFGEWFEAIARATRKSPPRAWIDDRALSLATRVTSRIAPTSFFAEALRMSDGASWAFSSDKARRDLGWSPRTLERGLEETMAHDKNRRALPWIFASTR